MGAPLSGIAKPEPPAHGRRMKINSNLTLHATADAAWTVIGEQYGEISKWTRALSASTIDGPVAQGAQRTCTTPGIGPFPAGTIVERIVAFDREAMDLTYEVVEGLPWFIRSARNRWSVSADGPDRCRVQSRAHLELHWAVWPLAPILRWSLVRSVKSVFEDLRHRVENGTERLSVGRKPIIAGAALPD